MIFELEASDAASVAARAGRARDAALGVAAQTALADCTTYVPFRTGRLRGSGQAGSDGGCATVAWGTDADTAAYARAQYYGAGMSHATDANAAAGGLGRAYWFEAARAAREGAWLEAFASKYREVVGRA